MRSPAQSGCRSARLEATDYESFRSSVVSGRKGFWNWASDSIERMYDRVMRDRGVIASDSTNSSCSCTGGSASAVWPKAGQSEAAAVTTSASEAAIASGTGTATDRRHQGGGALAVRARRRDRLSDSPSGTSWGRFTAASGSSRSSIASSLNGFVCIVHRRALVDCRISWTRIRPRWRRLLTVPIGSPTASATSATDICSTKSQQEDFVRCGFEKSGSLPAVRVLSSLDLISASGAGRSSAVVAASTNGAKSRHAAATRDATHSWPPHKRTARVGRGRQSFLAVTRPGCRSSRPTVRRRVEGCRGTRGSSDSAVLRSGGRALRMRRARCAASDSKNRRPPSHDFSLILIPVGGSARNALVRAGGVVFRLHDSAGKTGAN